ncbi:hypothetical protein [Altererythrobacter sp. TH136]|uniref:hypothetical protein n=1 Tax=Altererythrobacter sp. TH136 TaxID=2067415 RepID=UPI0011645706|nr:hypothetical protein [Altererythrobacter sp. TH136]QDM40879.1 hypothetical protein C0V74_07445 [Altererythrobacter sp. TH136]
MPYQGEKTPGNGPNQFAQVGMGGSQGGGQFEQGDGQSGSLQDQQGGTTTAASVPVAAEAGNEGAGTNGDFADQDRASGQQQQQQQNQSREQRAPGASNNDAELGTGRGDGTSVENEQAGSRA